MDWEREALRLLHLHFGHAGFRGAQRAVIRELVAGNNALVLMPTGGGKSLCYQIPALLRPGLGIVISPLIALMQDQVQALVNRGIAAAYLNSSLAPAQTQKVYAELRSGTLKMLYLAPERLVQPAFLEGLRRLELRSGIGLFAIDEAHCIAQWGHDFRPEYRQLRRLSQSFPQVPRIALTASADLQTRAEIIEQLDLGAAQQFINSFDRPNLSYAVFPKWAPTRQLMWFIQRRHPRHAGIVYCRSRLQVAVTARWLQLQGVAALPYHAGMGSELRKLNQERFLGGAANVMVATLAFGMGIDKPDVRFVLHLDCPATIEHYYQESGRAGRDGLPAEVALLYQGSELLTKFAPSAKLIPGVEGREQIFQAKARIMGRYCETRECRRKELLRALGEEYSGQCQGCDCCNPAIRTWCGPPVVLHDTLFAPKRHSVRRRRR